MSLVSRLCSFLERSKVGKKENGLSLNIKPIKVRSFMIIQPKIKGFVCITAHPMGCFENVRSQASLASELKLCPEKKPRRVLVIGSSTGYGLASRISATFGSGSETLGVFLSVLLKKENWGVQVITII